MTIITRNRLKSSNTKRRAATPVSPPQVMAAAVFAGPRWACVEFTALPEPGPGQVRVRLEGCGICGSSLPMWQGREWLRYPFEPGAPGHEGWGVVDAVGEGVESPALEARVAILSYHAYAEYDVVDAAHAVELPFALYGRPFPGEPLGCAVNIMRRAAINAGETVALIGGDFMGVLLTQLAVAAGARVIAIGRRDSALEMAGYFGAEETVALEDPRAIGARVESFTAGSGCDCVIETLGRQGALDLAGELVRDHGRLVIAGYHQDGPRKINMQLWNWKGLDVINAHERDPRVCVQGIRQAAAAVAAGLLTPAPLYTHAFALGELSRAFEMMERRPEGFLKAMVIL